MNAIPKGSLTDIDGNVYSTVTIGTQTWMAENLKTTKYRDGSSIIMAAENSVWATTTNGAYCWYHNDSANKDIYGALYNSYAVKTGMLAPIGWHIPTDNEWKILEIYLGMTPTQADKIGDRGTNQGKQLKSITGWEPSYNGVGNNTSGYTALPSGMRIPSGGFCPERRYGGWWSSSKYDSTLLWRRELDFYSVKINRNHWEGINGYSVRCVKD